jgi:hypothetical protein
MDDDTSPIVRKSTAAARAPGHGAIGPDGPFRDEIGSNHRILTDGPLLRAA